MDQFEIDSFFRRNLNILKENSIVQRKGAMKQIFEKIKSIQDQNLSQQILLNYGKEILQSFSDQVEMVRELSIQSLTELLSKCEDMKQILPYVISVLVERSNCTDLEGIAHLPEVMRPPPDQKPRVVVKLLETSEEVRLKLVNLMGIIISCTDISEIRDYIDEIVNILRTFCMDPFDQVQKLACQCLSQFCRLNKTILLNFTETMARALLFPLIAKNSKIKIAALEAMSSVLECGIWKFNAFVFEILTGFRDPNSVPIRAFYEPLHNINYFANLICDSKQQVREMFISCVSDWLIKLPDRWDHHARLVPYILSGLFDESQEIREIAEDTIEQVGGEWEREREKEIKEQKQLGVDSPWTKGGKLIDLPLPSPFKKRPKLGARGFIKNQVRKMWSALYKEIKDTKEENKCRAANLLLIAVIYTEEYMTQFLDQFITNTINCLQSKGKESSFEQESRLKIKLAYKLIGRYCDYKSYFPIISANIRGQFKRDEQFLTCALEALNQLLLGALEATVKEDGVQEKNEFILQVIDLMTENDQIEFISIINLEQAQNLAQTLILEYKLRALPQEYQDIMKIKGHQLLKFLNVLQYIDYFGQSIQINLPLEKQQLQQAQRAFKLSEIPQLKNAIKDYIEESNLIFEQKIVTFGDSNWDNLISILTYQIQIDQLYHQEIINALIKYLNTPDASDFFLKWTQIIFNSMKINDGIFEVCLQLSTLSIQWLEQQDNKFSKKLYDLLFIQIVKTIDTLTEQSNKQFWRNLKSYQFYVQLIISLISLQNKIYKNKQNDCIKMICNLIQIVLPYPSAKQLVTLDNKYMIPQTLNYIFDQIDVLGDTSKIQIRKTLMENLNTVLQYVPNSNENYYSGEQSVIPEYEALLRKLIKYTVEEKDLEIKEKYLNTLKMLKSKTPNNFYIELERAKNSKQLSRVELLQQL